LRYAHRSGEGPLVGTRATQIPLRHGRITELQRLSGFVFVRERGAAMVYAGGLPQAERADGGPAVLVRPDGYIAWAGESADRSAWSETLTRWLGRAGAGRLNGVSR
jgi:hypothetical protein